MWQTLPRNVSSAACLPCPAFEIIHDVHPNNTNATNTSNATYCDCVDPFVTPECPVPKNRSGIFVGLARKNTTADTPVFRFDGKFVCSVVRMAAGGHHTCLIFGKV
jgi:hypothetical protein